MNTSYLRVGGEEGPGLRGDGDARHTACIQYPVFL
jgi:hypothetical protein